MIKLLRNSPLKLNSYAKINYQLNYLSNVITGNNLYNRNIFTSNTQWKLLTDSVKSSSLEAQSKLKNPSQKPKNSNPSLNLMKCPTPNNKLNACETKNSYNKESGGQNTQVLKIKVVRDCNNSKPALLSTSFSQHSQSSNSGSSTKILLGLLLAGAGGGLIYYMMEQNKKIPPEDKSSVIIPVKVPVSSSEIPKHVPYLLIGGGTASFSAFRAIKSHDPTAKVMVISNEFLKPYMRPPLSKELWYNGEENVNPDANFRFKQWNGASRSLFYEPDEFYIDPTKLMEAPHGGVAVCQGYTVKKVLPFEQKVILSDDTEIKYDKCLIATGSTPKSLDILSAASHYVKEKVTVYRNTEDFLRLKAIVDSVQSITIIGSGFLGSELACALSKYGKPRNLQVFQAFYENGNMGKVLPEYLSSWTTKNVEKQGVNVISSAQVTSVERIHNKLKLNLNNGKTIVTDHVVVCSGCEANTDIAKLSGLEVDSKLGGFLVNAELEARKNLFVAGDAACFYDPLLGRRRVEHHDHSVISGRLAGENMTGLKNPYKHQSMFWSDLGPELGYEGIGLIDSSLPTVGVFAKMNSSNVSDEKVTASTDSTSQEISVEKDKNSSNNDITSTNSNSDNKATSTKVPTENSQSTSDDDDYGHGVIFYLKDNKVVGILLWNIFNRIGLARQIINQNKTYDDLNEVAKLFEIHS